jgi:hypothetical protein
MRIIKSSKHLSMSPTGGVAENELETLLCRQREVNSSQDSLLHTMCSVDADSAVSMLDCLKSVLTGPCNVWLYLNRYGIGLEGHA